MNVCSAEIYTVIYHRPFSLFPSCFLIAFLLPSCRHVAAVSNMDAGKQPPFSKKTARKREIYRNMSGNVSLPGTSAVAVRNKKIGRLPLWLYMINPILNCINSHSGHGFYIHFAENFGPDAIDSSLAHKENSSNFLAGFFFAA